jgi:hypothetical protein
MSILKIMSFYGNCIKLSGVILSFVIAGTVSCSDNKAGKGVKILTGQEEETVEQYNPVYAMLVLPANPLPGEPFRILSVGGRNIRDARITVSGTAFSKESRSGKCGEEIPYWRIDEFTAGEAGSYQASLIIGGSEVKKLEFKISATREPRASGGVWKAEHGWNSGYEALYSAWINALFQNCGESSSWASLHEVMQNKDQNILYNYLSLGEDDPANKNNVVMQPDCADNPFFFRAYFSWKLGLPFGYHKCDRGYLGKNPGTGEWVTNEISISRSNPVQSFNTLLRMVMDGVHSGTARTSLDNENSDYYPVALERNSLRPGTVYADPYGHTLIIVSWKPQNRDHPGLLLAVDAQPDKTIAVKRFWKGNFLFNTNEVVGEPGFKAFRPIVIENGQPRLLKNKDLTSSAGYIPFSMEQRKMESAVFYHKMERLINPKPLDPEDAMTDLINALHEQLLVRVKSVENGEAYFRSHPGVVIPMPSNANAIFQAGGQWEDFSTPNRDLRLLIAIDAIIDFPGYVAAYPEDFRLSPSASPEKTKEKLQSLLDRKVSSLSITYTRSDGSPQELIMAEILKRREALEMAYNPNDGAEIRWGAPENSTERSTCRRQAPPYQQKTMQAVRKWFNKRLHPPT